MRTTNTTTGHEKERVKMQATNKTTGILKEGVKMRARKNTMKFLSVLLSAAMVFGIFAAMPLTSYAATPAENVRNAIVNWNHGGFGGSLNVSITNGNTVTVTIDGDNLAVVTPLTLYIENGITVVWKAHVSANTATNVAIIELDGLGTFEVASGGIIVNAGAGNAITINHLRGIKLVVNDGQVLAKSGTAILYKAFAGNIIIQNGLVKSLSGRAIHCIENDPVIDITGGEVTSGGSVPTILAGNVNVSGGTVKNTGAYDAISAYKSVTVSGGEVISDKWSAIYMNSVGGAVKVSGGNVESRGTDYSHAICTGFSNSKIEVTGGTVKSVGDQGTIRAKDKADIKISGGIVNTTGEGTKSKVGIIADGANSTVKIGGDAQVSGRNCAIYAKGNTSTIEVNDGAVSSQLDCTVIMDAIDSVLKVTGGSIENTSSGNAIYVQGETIVSGGLIKSGSSYPTILSMNKSVTVNGGMICAKIGEAIRTVSASGTVRINSGFVFAYGTGIVGEGNVIKMASGSPTINTPAVVCVWNNPGGNPSYTEGSPDAISILPAGASAKWAKVGAESGIKYDNGANAGFFPIDGVTVNPVAAVVVPAITGPAALSLQAGYAATSSDAFTITGSPPPSVVKTSGDAAITWNNTTKKLDIAAGLAAGTYPVVLTATSGANSATHTFTLTVTPTPSTPTPAPAAPPAPGSGTPPVTTPTPPAPSTGSTPAAAAGSMANFKTINKYVPGQFSDVDENEWYGYNKYKPIANAFEYGLMKGSSATTFNPTGDITVEEAITVAARVHSIYKTGAENFAPSEPWSKVYVDYAIANGIIEANDFRKLDRAASRAEMAYIFSRSLPSEEFPKKNTVNSLPDVVSGFSSATGKPQTPHFRSIIMLYEAGVLAGNDEAGTFNPNANINRAEAAMIISRVILPDTRKAGNVFG